MDNQKEPLSRLAGGSGTYADPYRFTSKLLRKIDHIHTVGRYVPGQIAEARELLAQTDAPEEFRRELEERITDLEYRWHLGRAAHLVRQAFGQFQPEAIAAKKRAEFLRQAHDARNAFSEFARAHPEVHDKHRLFVMAAFGSCLLYPNHGIFFLGRPERPNPKHNHINFDVIVSR